MTSNSLELRIGRPVKTDLLYYMCLLDWKGVVLDEKTHKVIASVVAPNGQEVEGWYVLEKKDSLLKGKGVKPEFFLGFYHSRIIFRFELTECPKNISRVREIRQEIENYIESYLKDNILSQLQKLSNIYPRAFLFPVFELNSHCPIWKFGGTSPYILPTTCFYTALSDPKRPRRAWLDIPFLRTFVTILSPATVQIRASGGKIITSPMSEWFFWNLTNLIYHEGLYRKCREQPKGKAKVYKGLEEHIEHLADRLLTSFSQSVANVVRVNLNLWLVSLTILLIVVTAILIIIGLK
jgi:hypothetical protein